MGSTPEKCVWFLGRAYSVLSHVCLFAALQTVACQAPLFMRFSRQEHWSGLPCLPPGDLPDPGIELMSLTFLALAGGFFTTSGHDYLGHEDLFCAVLLCIFATSS